MKHIDDIESNKIKVVNLYNQDKTIDQIDKSNVNNTETLLFYDGRHYGMKEKEEFNEKVSWNKDAQTKQTQEHLSQQVTKSFSIKGGTNLGKAAEVRHSS